MARAAEIALAISLAEAADTYRVDEGAMCAGADRLERGGADGTPLISEFLASELGPLLGLSPAATGWRIADTLNLRHRHPQLWRAFVGGEVRWWPALQVARRCAEAHLGVEAARFVDRQVAAALAVQPLGRVLRNLDRLIVAADPALARQRADEAAAFRAVGVGPARDGHVALWGTLDAADGLALDEALDAIADAMPAEVPRGHRRAAGLGELARGAFGQDPLPRHVELIVRLDRPESPAATIDGVGTVLREQLADLLAGSRYTIRPIVDPHAIEASDGYDIPGALRLAVTERNPVDVFPFGTRSARGCDLDHTIPFDHRAAPGAGQTRYGNLGPLSRRAHRAKTHAGWSLAQRSPGVFEWASPAGYRYLVTPAGTTRLRSPHAGADAGRPRRRAVRPHQRRRPTRPACPRHRLRRRTHHARRRLTRLLSRLIG